ncbi:MAG: beta-ketoacyl-ACP synthase II [Bacteroidetes bacterium]|jgi:3-oxoacyl-[acyl-carrier-protein] synthase II|nr:beta-ketoacyl-ACP synthase II [Bacteroidota bacterium]MBT5529331.1 beta-ketoacyl-ACP synthase II [Cytophagia bacterium]MBT3422757.1 beta-ketoacyl-ACP synthase II [Bacteroidota bacterium]MBT3934062.1 beta-ketoacyl-ACP synthase II [Bacteroidota bacterium]MBT4337993.1 beta-ketoacyl-ACP synthase II [Bacteroidota bacterium]
MDHKRVVVTGIGLVTPLGHTIDEVWGNAVKGVSAAGPITKFDPEKFKTKFACEVKDFKPEDYIDRKEARRMDLFTQYALVAANKAIALSGLDLEKLDLDRCGVIWASGIGGIKTFQEEILSFAGGDGTPRFNPFFIPKMIADIAAGLISMRFGFRGVNFATVSACASSSNAIGAAFEHIRSGREDIVITGGSEACIVEASVGGFNAMKAMSERNDDPKTASRPFDVTRDGFVMGEGGAGLVLEEYEHAIARGATIYGEIIGAGYSADAHHLTAPHPDGNGAYMVMKKAIADAGIEPEMIDYINVHGTATPLGDISETKAVQRLFGEHAYKLNISSTKSMHGHLLGAAGAMEAVMALLAIQHSVVPPTINHKEADPNIDPKLNLTLNKAQERNIDYALSNTFGFGGHNVSLIFKKYIS